MEIDDGEKREGKPWHQRRTGQPAEFHKYFLYGRRQTDLRQLKYTGRNVTQCNETRDALRLIASIVRETFVRETVDTIRGETEST